MSDPEQVARAVLRAYFEGADFHHVPPRCVKAVEGITPASEPPVVAIGVHIERKRYRDALEKIAAIFADRQRYVMMGPRGYIEAEQIAQEALAAPLTGPLTCASCGQSLTVDAQGKINHHCPPKGSSTLVEPTQVEVLCDGCKDEADSKLYAGPQGMRLCAACLLDCGGSPERDPVVYCAPTEGKQRG